MKRIYCRIEQCMACKACEIACAVAHSESKNLTEALREAETPRRRIDVRVLDGEGDLIPSRAIAIQCRHCDDPACVEACRERCIHKNGETGEVYIDHESCSGCWACIKACPYGAIVRHRGLRIALLCDHCPDREVPACVAACRTRALVYCEREEIETDYAEMLRTDE